MHAKILVVEDETMSRTAVGNLLADLGHSPELCASAEQGLAQFDRTIFDVVISDVTLPGLDGLEMVRRMRATDPALVPIIMTGLRDQQTAVRALEYGARRFLTKPIQESELQEKVKEALKERQQAMQTRRMIADLIQERSQLQQRVVQQNQRLSHTERYLNHLLDAAPFGILSTDVEGRILTINRKAKELYGYGDLEILGQYISALSPAINEQTSGLHRRKDGGTFPALVHQRDIVDFDECLIARLYVIEDQTERLQLEDQLLYADRLSLLGEMAPHIAHEFKTPLQLVSGYAGMALQAFDRNDSPLARSSVENIEPAAQEMTQLVEQIANLGKPAASQRIALDLRQEVEKTVHGLRDLGVVKQCSIICKFAADLPAVIGDPTQIDQLFRNLIVNAAQAMEKSTLRQLNLKVAPDTDGTRLEVSISDTGLGIDPDTLEQIFRPFFTTKEKGQGTGLGLAIVQTIIKRHNGTIRATSEKGKGTCFHLTFPTFLKN